MTALLAKTDGVVVSTAEYSYSEQGIPVPVLASILLWRAMVTED